MTTLPLFDSAWLAPTAPPPAKKKTRKRGDGILFSAPDASSELIPAPGASSELIPAPDASSDGVVDVVDGVTRLELPAERETATERELATERVWAEGSGRIALVPAVAAIEPVVEPVVEKRTDRGVLVFDVETTGTDRRRDQVIELCVQFGLAEGAPSRTWRIKPEVAISPGAQAVHGISMDDLADCPTFGDLADEIAAVFAEAEVLVGYNLAFDIDMITSEYERLGRPAPAWSGKTVIDAFRMWQQCEPRNLSSAHQRFVGHAFAAAHSATADVAATGRVLEGMLRTFGLDAHDWRSVALVCDPARPNWVGPSRHLQWQGERVILAFGKHSGTPLHQIDPGYLRWMAERDFPGHVTAICMKAATLPEPEFLAWIRAEYGAPPAPVQPPVRTP